MIITEQVSKGNSYFPNFLLTTCSFARLEKLYCFDSVFALHNQRTSLKVKVHLHIWLGYQLTAQYNFSKVEHLYWSTEKWLWFSFCTTTFNHKILLKAEVIACTPRHWFGHQLMTDLCYRSYYWGSLEKSAHTSLFGKYKTFPSTF